MSNKSLFNKTLLKKDFKILMPIFIFSMAMFILMLPFNLSQSFYTIKNETDIWLVQRAMNSIEVFIDMSFIGIAIAVINAHLLFAYEKQTKTFEMLTSLPFSRKQIYVNKVAVGLFVTTMPLIIGYAISHFILLMEPASVAFVNMDLLPMSFLIFFTMELTVFAFYTMFSMIFGNSLSTMFFGTACAFMPAGIVGLAEWLFGGDRSMVMTDFMFRFTPFSVFISSFNFKYSFIYLSVFFVIFIIAGYILFDMTKMEKITEFLTFKGLEIPFKIVFFLCSAMLGATMLDSIFNQFYDFSVLNKIIGFVIGGAIGYLIPKKVIGKSRVA